MNHSFTFERLASSMSEKEIVLRYRSTQTSDAIEEVLYAWRDAQASVFARSIHEPQQTNSSQLPQQIAEIQSSMLRLEIEGTQAEKNVARVYSLDLEINDNHEKCESSVKSIQYYVSDALAKAADAQKGANKVISDIASLGSPPV